ncbi:aspartate racemase [Anaerotignum neopropionicum]|uniref:Aspartate racemase n=1 Tax=Anaerotignum neopropionicum TaxID=36847 RepID=A0A136WBH8_9FIRM|nr:aspartate/glutamate racemase family protein [Anaerotignum neopropionicum]KXL51679.1 aspartate racemase [Anaerotignum neopropionicum]
MKTIGLIGGMSWESTVTYYQVLNETIKNHLGGLHSAKCILYSVDFQEIEKYQASGHWEKSGKVLSEAALSLEKAGADFIILCTNTMHKIAPMIEEKISIPLLHIAEATGDELLLNHITKVGLLGTKYTMTQDFYKDKFLKKGIEVLIPTVEDMEIINSIIFQELCRGQIKENSKKEYLRIIHSLYTNGAQGIVLGCTEIGLLVHPKDTSVPLFDTTLIHAKKAAQASLT